MQSLESRSILLALIVGLSSASHPWAQADRAPVRFDVVSVKPNNDLGRSRVDLAGGRFSAVRIALQDLVRMAYPIQESIRTDEQIVGGPDWIKSEHFDVIATIGATAGAPSIDTRRTPGAVQPPETEELNQVRSTLR